MRPGVLNLIVGGIMLVGGLSGKLVFLGTDSGLLLAGLGAIIAGIGIYQMIKYK